MGVVAALIPSTNPTSTTMYKSIISIKAGNAIVISPHPNAKECIIKTAEIISRAAAEAGAPDGIIQCISLPSMEATDALLKSRQHRYHSGHRRGSDGARRLQLRQSGAGRGTGKRAGLY